MTSMLEGGLTLDEELIALRDVLEGMVARRLIIPFTDGDDERYRRLAAREVELLELLRVGV